MYMGGPARSDTIAIPGMCRAGPNKFKGADMAMVEVVGGRRLGGFKLDLNFSDGSFGVQDFESILHRSGTMIEPLKDPRPVADIRPNFCGSCKG
jgi:hypothetical protein